jgi:hypothetical protein
VSHSLLAASLAPKVPYSSPWPYSNVALYCTVRDMCNRLVGTQDKSIKFPGATPLLRTVLYPYIASIVD